MPGFSDQPGPVRKTGATPTETITVAHERSVFARVSARGKSIAEYFRFLPIRFKLSLIIGAIVLFVLSMLSLILIQTQEAATLQRVSQVSGALIRNLAETVKGDLLRGESGKVKEAVLRLNNAEVEGLKRAVVVNHEAELVAGFDKDGEAIELANPQELLQYRQFSVVESDTRFKYFCPITAELQENSEAKQILLGVAFISFSKRAVLAPVRLARKIALASALLIVIFAFVGINMITKKMTNQIKLLSDGARQVGNGNLSLEILVDSKDELGRLATEFNSMIRQLREKLQMQKFVSKLTVEMIKETVRSDGRGAVAVKRNLTVLFSDLRDFSSIAEHLDPEEIVKLLNIYFNLQTRIIERYNGIVDKFMGDQIMAIFQGEQMSENALCAAVEIQRQIKLVNQEREIRGKTSLEVGVGINCGSAVIGNMGSAHRMDYTVIGDVVNVAARLCTAAHAGQIITSFDVANDVDGSYPTSRLKSISVKGRSQPIAVCEVDYDRDIIA